MIDFEIVNLQLDILLLLMSLLLYNTLSFIQIKNKVASIYEISSIVYFLMVPLLRCVQIINQLFYLLFAVRLVWL